MSIRLLSDVLKYIFIATLFSFFECFYFFKLVGVMMSKGLLSHDIILHLTRESTLLHRRSVIVGALTAVLVATSTASHLLIRVMTTCSLLVNILTDL